MKLLSSLLLPITTRLTFIKLYITKIRFRNWFMVIGVTTALLLSILMDPDLGVITQMTFGTALVAQLTIMSKAFLFIALLHFSRKALADYIDLEDLFKRALGSPGGAGSAIIGVGLVMVSLAIVIYTAVHE